MAQRVKVLLLDDITGEDADETIEFGLDGVRYAIDLTEANAARLRAALAEFIRSGRREGGRSGSRGRPRDNAKPSIRHDRQQLQAVRDWARKRGYEISDRGRIPRGIWEAFDEEHKS